jgi:hypothetical protein
MRYRLILLSLYISTISYGQNCHCEDNPELNEIVSCDTISFSNKAKLYRRFNCDSSWLTFESKLGKKTVLYSLEQPLIELTERLGYQYIQEYQKSFLIMNNLISGCCTPPEYLLFSKDNGQLIKNIGGVVYYSERRSNNFLLYFTNSSLNSLTLFYVDTGKRFNIRLPVGRFTTTLEKTGDLYGEYLFDEASLANTKFSIGYRYQRNEKADKWYTGKVTIDLNQYAR